MGVCRTYHSKRLRLEEIASYSYATTLELICGEFNDKSEKNMLEISYLTKKIANMKSSTKQEKSNPRTF